MGNSKLFISHNFSMKSTLALSLLFLLASSILTHKWKKVPDTPCDMMHNHVTLPDYTDSCSNFARDRYGWYNGNTWGCNTKKNGRWICSPQMELEEEFAESGYTSTDLM